MQGYSGLFRNAGSSLLYLCRNSIQLKNISVFQYVPWKLDGILGI